MSLLKFLFTAVAALIFIRLLLRLLSGAFHIRIEKHYFHHDPVSDHKPEGYVTLDGRNAKKKAPSHTAADEEYVDYEEIK